ncbi:Uncharacterized protein dnm_056560 [Desulfonema magnum]|uniref:Uncharacterized protein n=1 Tax=Desulfonema magnum TaxID=45655 RepID=A0A975BQB6_9BACT|nr:Uncharacterized protein dnm_056560 [Desulfonema magnum]
MNRTSEDAVLGRGTFTQEELQELDLNKDIQVFIIKKRGLRMI